MKAAFTICTNSYLAQAATLAKSLKKYAPAYTFYVFLVDVFSSAIDYASIDNVTFRLAAELPIDFNDLNKRYTIIELNTSIKASCFKWLFSNENMEQVHYFDPDISLFSSIDRLDQHFDEAEILITPHILTPIPWQEGSPNENLFLNHGLYNLGYLGLKRGAQVPEMLDWWEDHLLKRGYYHTRQGFFVDQLWINYVPIFFNRSTRVLLDPGFNMGPWNLHERTLTETDGRFYVNNDVELLFFHFSSFNLAEEQKYSAPYRYTAQSNPDLIPLYAQYRNEMIKNNAVFFSGIRWAYEKKKPFYKKWFRRKYKI